MAKRVPWAQAAPRTDCSRENKPPVLPSNRRMGPARWRFHPGAPEQPAEYANAQHSVREALAGGDAAPAVHATTIRAQDG